MDFRSMLKVFTIGLVFLMFFCFVLDVVQRYKSPDLTKCYAEKVSLKEYESQKGFYTHQKLAELYASKEYQDYIRGKLDFNGAYEYAQESDDD
jgi:hypothetical protein